MTLFEEGTPPPSAPEPVEPSAPAQRIRMTVAYDGSGFHGFAANPGVTTVARRMAEAIAKVLGHPVALTCAGRTDSGVHAWGQVVHFDTDRFDADSEADRFDTDSEAEVDRLQRSLNKMLAPAIVVRDAALSPAGFDARRSATGRRYRYTVLNRPLPDPFLASMAWHVPEPLDLQAMQLGCDPLFGEHDWSSFCRKPPAPDASMVRVVREARWVDVGEALLRFDIEASAFCHQMVRSVVGTLVAVGKAKLRAGDMAWIIRSKDRSLAGEPAPPHGLCLWEVLYE